MPISQTTASDTAAYLPRNRFRHEGTEAITMNTTSARTRNFTASVWSEFSTRSSEVVEIAHWANAVERHNAPRGKQQPAQVVGARHGCFHGGFRIGGLVQRAPKPHRRQLHTWFVTSSSPGFTLDRIARNEPDYIASVQTHFTKLNAAGCQTRTNHRGSPSNST
jgi:hypothetical protein